jgi:hypothetical protein
MKKMILVLVLLLALLAVGVSVASAGSVYLPIVNKSQPTPTPTPNPDPVLLPNGNFEQGHKIWEEYSNFGYDIIRPKDEISVPPHSGSWAAWMGGTNNIVETLRQTVLVPSDHPYLSFWLWIISTDACDKDFAYVDIGNDRIDTHDLCYDHNTYGWVQKVYDLRAYRGQSVDLILAVETNATIISSIYLDDFEFNTSQTP